METLQLPFRFHTKYYADRRRTNVNLNSVLWGKAESVARDRYGISRSELMNQLLDAELKNKKGILRLHQGHRAA